MRLIKISSIFTNQNHLKMISANQLIIFYFELKIDHSKKLIQTLIINFCK